MELHEIQALKKELIKNFMVGDYITVGRMLGVTQSTARMRFTRSKEDCVLALKAVIDAREALIKSYQSSK